MKKKSTISILFVLFFTASLLALSENPPTKTDDWPKKVKSAIDKSCYGCHNSGAKNNDAKEALNFDKLDELSLIKQVSSYSEIGKTIEKKEMPPEQFLGKYPDKKLSDDEKKLLVEWSNKEAEQLVKNR